MFIYVSSLIATDWSVLLNTVFKAQITATVWIVWHGSTAESIRDLFMGLLCDGEHILSCACLVVNYLVQWIDKYEINVGPGDVSTEFHYTHAHD